MSYLVDIKSIKKQAFTGGNVEDTMIASTLLRIQDVMLQPILGTCLYQRLQQGVKDKDLNSHEEGLLKNQVFNFLVAAVDLRIIKPLTFKIKAKGVGTLRDEHMIPLTNSERVEFEDDLRGDLDFYKNELIGFLKENSSLFPEYEDCECSDDKIQPTNSKDIRTNIRFV